MTDLVDPRKFLKPNLKCYRKFHCHPLIRDTAKGLAEAVWEEKCSRDNSFFEIFGSKTGKAMFVGVLMPKLVSQARATLTDMLSGPYPDELKEEIADALIKTHDLHRGQTPKPRRGLHI